VKKVTVLRKGAILSLFSPFSHITFLGVPYHMRSSYRIRKVLCFIVDCKSPCKLDCNGKVPYSMAKCLITMAVTKTEEDDNETLVKELKKCE